MFDYRSAKLYSNEMKAPKKLKTKRNIKHKVAYSKAIREEVLRFMENGDSIDDLHASNPSKYPTSAVVGTWIETDPIFAEKANKARRILVQRLVEKLHWMRNNPPNRDEFVMDTLVKIGKDKQLVKLFNDKAYGQATQIWKQQLSSIHNEIKELGAIFNVKYTKITKTEHKGEHLVQQVQIIDYAAYDSSTDDKSPKDDRSSAH